MMYLSSSFKIHTLLCFAGIYESWETKPCSSSDGDGPVENCHYCAIAPMVAALTFTFSFWCVIIPTWCIISMIADDDEELF